MVTDSQRECFLQDGLLSVPGAFDAGTVGELRQYVDALLAAPEVPGGPAVYRELNLLDASKQMVARVENFCPAHPELDRLCRLGPLRDGVASLLAEPAVLFLDKINCKAPGGSNGWRPHQDQDAEWGSYCALFVTVAVAIDPSTAGNGALQFARGEHLRSFATGSPRLLTLREMESMRYELVEMAPGDAVFFSSYTPHCSAPNLSDRPRRLLYLTFNRFADGDHRARHFAAKRLEHPPDVDRDPSARSLFHYRSPAV